MEGYITFSQFVLLIIILVVVMVGGYLILTRRNVNIAISSIGLVLK